MISLIKDEFIPLGDLYENKRGREHKQEGSRQWGRRMENVHDSNDELYPWANVGF